MFVMNFKEIHSNTEFLSTYRRARACSCQNKIKNTFIEKFDIALTKARTPDIYEDGFEAVNTSQMGDLVASLL